MWPFTSQRKARNQLENDTNISGSIWVLVFVPLFPVGQFATKVEYLPSAFPADRPV